MYRTHVIRRGRLAEFAELTPAQDGSGQEFVVPENLGDLSTDDIVRLHDEAQAHFKTIYGDGGNDLSADDLETLQALADGVTSLAAEKAKRDEDAEKRRQEAASIAEKAGLTFSAEDDKDEDADEADAVVEVKADENVEVQVEDEVDKAVEEDKDEALTASAPARRQVRVNLSSVAKHLPKAEANTAQPQGISDMLMLSGQVSGFRTGANLTLREAGDVLTKQLSTNGFRSAAQAARAGQAFSAKTSLFSLAKPVQFAVDGEDGQAVEDILKAASNPDQVNDGQGLVAAGGWCAPSETVYTMLAPETRDGIFSLPEVTLKRGGIRRTLGPNFGDLFSVANGWHYTEQQDIDGMYGVDANGIGNGTPGTKPCIEVTCPEFEEFRLEVDGLCISSGILQSAAYPEMISRFISGVMIAHEHKRAGRILSEIASQSQAVTFNATQAGATAPLLTAIELRAQVLRSKTRMGRTAVLEAVFPEWVKGLIRADLSRRLGVDLISVPDSRILGWFRERKINPQFVYNWQDLGTGADVVTFPNKVEFLLYPAGTWVNGTNSLLTIDTLYDSTLLAENNYTALWTEEANKVIRMGHESDRISLTLSADGATHTGIDILHDGTEGAATPAV